MRVLQGWQGRNAVTFHTEQAPSHMHREGVQPPHVLLCMAPPQPGRNPVNIPLQYGCQLFTIAQLLSAVEFLQILTKFQQNFKNVWGKQGQLRLLIDSQILVFVTMVTECLGETRAASSAGWVSCYCVLHYLTMTHFGLPVSYQHLQFQHFNHTLVW